ncbi:MAG: spiro-SPASM protein [Treponema sp.]
MRSLIVLFANGSSESMFEPLFDGKSAFERALDWAQSLVFIKEKEIAVFASASVEEKCRSSVQKADVSARIHSRSKWTVKALFEEFAAQAKEADASDIVYAFADCPFLSAEGAKEVFESHINYAAEYTFADGYPYGLVPEVLNAGAARILNSLMESNLADEGKKPLSRASVFDLIKKDINSFDVETVIAPFDARLFRVSLCCATKAETAACAALFTHILEQKPFADFSLDELSRAACADVAVLKTLPSFYNVQISARDAMPSVYIPRVMSGVAGAEGESADGGSDENAFMDADKFKSLIESIAEFSGRAVVSVSAWGEPLLHPSFVELCRVVLAKSGLTLLIETDGVLVTEELCAALKSIVENSPECKNEYGKILWIVRVDAFTAGTYEKIHGTEEHFAQAVNAVSVLHAHFPGAVYPQLVRMNANEDELENFYRFWSAKESPSGGNHIIQKYSTFCGTLADEKPADLSPLTRNPCWHIRRDLTILADGSIPFCRECLKSHVIANAFTDGLKTAWEKLTPFVQEQMNGTYCDFCGKCDEYYTFNF